MRREDLLKRRRLLSNSGKEMKNYYKKNRKELSRQQSSFMTKGLRRNKTRQKKLLPN